MTPLQSIWDSLKEFGWDIKVSEAAEKQRCKGEEETGVEEEEGTKVPSERKPSPGLDSPKQEKPTEHNLLQPERPSSPQCLFFPKQ